MCVSGENCEWTMWENSFDSFTSLAHSPPKISKISQKKMLSENSISSPLNPQSIRKLCKEIFLGEALILCGFVWGWLSIIFFSIVYSSYWLSFSTVSNEPWNCLNWFQVIYMIVICGARLIISITYNLPIWVRWLFRHVARCRWRGYGQLTLTGNREMLLCNFEMVFSPLDATILEPNFHLGFC